MVYLTKDIERDRLRSQLTHKLVLSKRLEVIEEAFGLDRSQTKLSDAVETELQSEGRSNYPRPEASSNTGAFGSHKAAGKPFASEIVAIKRAREAGDSDPLSVLSSLRGQPSANVGVLLHTEATRETTASNLSQSGSVIAANYEKTSAANVERIEERLGRLESLLGFGRKVGETSQSGFARPIATQDETAAHSAGHGLQASLAPASGQDHDSRSTSNEGSLAGSASFPLAAPVTGLTAHQVGSTVSAAAPG